MTRSLDSGANPAERTRDHGEEASLGIIELCLIGAMLGVLWLLTKIVLAIIDLLEMLITVAIVLTIALVLLVTLVMHAKPV